MNLDLLG